MNRTFRNASLVFVVLLLGGCADLTARGTRANPEGRVQFDVDSPYEDVFQRIYTNAQRCLDSTPRVVRGSIFPNNKSAEVMLNLVGTAAMPLVVDIRAVPSGTSVTASYKSNIFDMWQRSAQATKRWANGDNSYCPEI